MPGSSPPRDESLRPRLLRALTACGLPARYYGWCDRFPRLSAEAGTGEGYQPSRGAMLAAWAATGVGVTKPARRLQVASRPAGDQTVQLSTTTYRLGGTIVIAAGITGSAGYDSADLAVLCVELLERSGRRPPQPAYPRPIVASDQQLVDLVAEVAALLDDLAPAVEAAGAG